MTPVAAPAAPQTEKMPSRSEVYAPAQRRLGVGGTSTLDPRLVAFAERYRSQR